MSKKKQIPNRTCEDLIRRFTEEADKRGVTRQQLLNEALEEKIKTSTLEERVKRIEEKLFNS